MDGARDKYVELKDADFEYTDETEKNPCYTHYEFGHKIEHFEYLLDDNTCCGKEIYIKMLNHIKKYMASLQPLTLADVKIIIQKALSWNMLVTVWMR